MPGAWRVSLRARARKIRLLAMDVDGVLTDGSIVILNSGEEVKFWNVKDRIGFYMLKGSGKKFYTAWITGRQSRQVANRAREIGVDVLHQRCHDKKKAMEAVLKKFRLKPEQALFIGDDLVDLRPLRLAGLSVCPADACAEVKKVSDVVSRVSGGRGVLREAVEFVLQSQGLWKEVMRRYDDPTVGR